MSNLIKQLEGELKAAQDSAIEKARAIVAAEAKERAAYKAYDEAYYSNKSEDEIDEKLDVWNDTLKVAYEARCGFDSLVAKVSDLQTQLVWAQAKELK